ncbi:kinase-like protein [Calocera cornea HHB12733]|uniref:Kinase-like protein n=1 Tax=Calocera cornea HHB12733 TaxID=1353952 RepID=A0A165ERC8_9BASI|nr:kinase-like protein [Calocera cornea HHB12733]
MDESYEWTLGPHIHQLFLGQTEDIADCVQSIRTPWQTSQGGFGRVYKVGLTKLGAKVWGDGAVAVKVLHDYKWNPKQRLMLGLREAWVWSQLGHKNILPFWGIADYKDLCPGSPSQLCMFSPWAPFGNVEEFLKTSGDKGVKLPFLLDIARGVDYLHSVKPTPILHGDLKGSNVLVVVNRGNTNGWALQAQLSDFGLSKMAIEMDSNMSTTSTTFNGNVRWLAWERMNPQQYNIERGAAAMSAASDVFEMMRTFLQIMTEKVPYHGSNEWQVQQKIIKEVNPERPSHGALPLDELMWHMMLRCWSPRRTERYDCKTVMTIVEYTIVMEGLTVSCWAHGTISGSFAFLCQHHHLSMSSYTKMISKPGL